MTFEKKFDSLKKSFAKADTKKFTESFAFQINMTDEDCGGAFYVAFINGNYAVEPYDYVDRTALITGSAADVAKLAKGTVAVTVEGNADQVAMFAASFKKPAAKKAATKKAPAKKAEAKVEKKAEPAKKVEKKAEPAKKVEAKKVEAKVEAKVEKKAEPAKKPAAKKAPAKKAEKK